MSPFSTKLLFFTLAVIGLVCVPLLSIKLTPERIFPTIKISCYWAGATQAAIEAEVTSQLEGVFSLMERRRRIYSKTQPNYTDVFVEFEQGTDLQKARFKISSMTRQVYNSLPEGVSYPSISYVLPQGHNATLMSFAISGIDEMTVIQRFMDKSIVPVLSKVRGVSDIKVEGLNEKYYLIEYDPSKLNSLGILESEITKSIQDHLQPESFGISTVDIDGVKERLTVSSLTNHSLVELQELPVVVRSSRIIRLKEICSVREKYLARPSRYRVNGEETISLTITAHTNANQIRLAKNVRNLMREIQSSVPKYKFTITYDSIQYLESELLTMGIRASASILLVLIFTVLLYLSIRHILILIVGLITTILISIFILSIFSISIHIYSLIAFSLSIGFVVDNLIIAIDHFKRTSNREILLPLLATTITTIIPLLLFNGMDESLQLNLIEFGWVLIVMLCASVAVSGWLIPNLVKVVPEGKRKKSVQKLRKVSRSLSNYLNILFWLRRFRFLIFIVLILLLGIPVFLLPKKIGTNHWAGKVYNHTVGSAFYSNAIRPVTDKLLGGVLRLLIQNGNYDKQTDSYQRPSLKLILTAPFGSTPDYLNNICKRYELVLKDNWSSGIDLFETRIVNNQNAQIEVFFRKGFISNGFPYFLKGFLEKESLKISGINFILLGIGEPFGSGTGEFVDSNLVLTGFNYDELTRYAEKIKSELSKNFRVEEVLIKSEPSWLVRSSKKYVASVSKLDVNSILLALSDNYTAKQVSGVGIDAEYSSIVIQSAEINRNSFWDLMNHSIQPNDSMAFKPKYSLDVSLDEVPENIFKEDQEYKLVVQYKFKGTKKLCGLLNQQLIEKFKSRLQAGYKVYDLEIGESAMNTNKVYWIVLVCIVLIFQTSATFLESYRKALLIVICIPVTFVGLLFVLYQAEIVIDSGVYCGIVMSTGLLVSSAILLMFEYHPRATEPRSCSFLRAYRRKIVPIMISSLPTVVSLVPFIFQNEVIPFWFSFSLTTSVSLVVSLLVIVFILPIFLIEKRINIAATQ